MNFRCWIPWMQCLMLEACMIPAVIVMIIIRKVSMRFLVTDSTPNLVVLDLSTSTMVKRLLLRSFSLIRSTKMFCGSIWLCTKTLLSQLMRLTTELTNTKQICLQDM